MGAWRCERCGSYDARCDELQARMTGRRFTWPAGAVCADVVDQAGDMGAGVEPAKE